MGTTAESGKLERWSFQLQKWETLGEETLHDFGQENSEIPVVAQVRYQETSWIAKSGVNRDQHYGSCQVLKTFQISRSGVSREGKRSKNDGRGRVRSGKYSVLAAKGQR